MNFHLKTVLLFIGVSLGCAAPRCAGADPDPYAPLKLYEGAWKVRMSGHDQQPDHLVNRCSRTGTFFSCEQELNRKTAALVIFLSSGHNSSAALEYRTLAVLADASKPDDWGRLTIDGQTWTYAWMQKDGEKTVEMRNVNQFRDNDHIHFEVQKHAEDGTWKTQFSGDEERVK